MNPGVELPRSFIRGVLLLAAIYVLINAALLYSLDMTRLASENLPLARLAQIVSGERGAVVFCWLMTLILISSANAAVLAATRVLFAWWYAGHPAFPYRTGGDWFSTFWIVYAGIGGNHVFFVSKYLLSYLAVFVLPGRSRDDAAVPGFGHPWTAAGATIGSVLYLTGVVAADTRNTLYGCVVLIASYPIYRLLRGTLRRLRPTEIMLKIVLAETDMQYQQVRELFSELSAWDTADEPTGSCKRRGLLLHFGRRKLPGDCAPLRVSCSLPPVQGRPQVARRSVEWPPTLAS